MPIDPHSYIPIYEQIIEHIHGTVAAGVYQPNEPLPSVRALAIELHVNPNTVQRAYQELEKQHLITTRRGLGAFVTANGRQTARAWLETAVRMRLRGSIEAARTAGATESDIRALFEQAIGTDKIGTDKITAGNEPGPTGASQSPSAEMHNDNEGLPT
jgi:GntR family transcriptional regulator